MSNEIQQQVISQMVEQIHRGKKFQELQGLLRQQTTTASFEPQYTLKASIATAFHFAARQRPSPRAVAEFLQAPYSLVFQAWKESTI